MILNAQGCAECGKGNGYALYCVPCHAQFKAWVEITKGQILAIHANTATPEEFGYEIEALCRTLNRL